MDFGKLAKQAEGVFKKRGGSKALKEDLDELKDIASTKGSLGDKAKAAADAVKDPGEKGGERR